MLVSTEKFLMTLITAASEQESVLDHWICVDKAGHPQCPHIQSHNLGAHSSRCQKLCISLWVFICCLEYREGGKEGGREVSQSSHTRALMVPLRHTEGGWHFGCHSHSESPLKIEGKSG